MASFSSQSASPSSWQSISTQVYLAGEDSGKEALWGERKRRVRNVRNVSLPRVFNRCRQYWRQRLNTLGKRRDTPALLPPDDEIGRDCQGPDDRQPITEQG